MDRFLVKNVKAAKEINKSKSSYTSEVAAFLCSFCAVSIHYTKEKDISIDS